MNQQNNNQQVNGQNFVGFGPQQLTDFFVSNLVLTKLGDIMKNNVEFSFSSILILFMVMTINEFKNVFVELLRNFINLLKKLPFLILENLKSFYEKYKIRKIYKKKEVEEILIEEQTINQICMKVDYNFMINLYNFINKKKKQIKFDEFLQKVEIKNSKEIIFALRITNCEFYIGKIPIKILGGIEYYINNFNDEINSVIIDDIQINKTKKITSYLELLTAEQAEIIRKIKKEVMIIFGDVEDLKKKLYNINHSSMFTEYTIVRMILEKYPQLNEKDTTFEIIILSYILHYNLNIYVSNVVFQSVKLYNKMIFDKSNFYYKDLNNFNYNSCLQQIQNDFAIIINRNFISNTLVSIFSDFSNNNFSELKKKNENQYFDINFQLGSENQLVERNQIIKKLIVKIYKYNKKKNSSIKIFSLHLENEKIIREEPNPSYETWLEKKNLLELNSSKKEEPNNIEKKNNGNNKIFNKFIQMSIPSKTIIKEIYEKKIIVKLLNEIEKDFETLYLKKADKDKLFNCLYQFRDKKEIFKQLGLPHKLNILLYGEPGTGKSTTIQAVATYLNKDIYYVDLKEAKSNKDLQMMFEYVNKVANSGIIVIEDVDAMTKVVLKREKKTLNLKVNELINNEDSELSLEYFLNILQGTLTLDDSIFIVTTNHLDLLDDAFYRDGRFDVKLHLSLCDHHQINSIYHKFLNKEISENILKMIPENKFSPATVIFHIKNYIFCNEINDSIILEPFLNKKYEKI